MANHTRRASREAPRFAWASAATATVAVLLVAASPHTGGAQSLTLTPVSQGTLNVIGATAGDVIVPSVPPTHGPMPPPMVELPGLRWALLPNDVIDAIAFWGPASIANATIYFSVTSASNGLVGPYEPDVYSESLGNVPVGLLQEQGADIFATNDPTCAPFGANSQVLDGDGFPIGPLSCYPGYGTGLLEVLPMGAPHPNDDINSFAWKLPGWVWAACNVFSLAPGSPSLFPGRNPALPSGGEPGDVLQWCLGVPSRIERPVHLRAAALGLVSGGPGCLPPACDDIDAIAYGIYYSLSNKSPSVPSVSGADILQPPGLTVIYTAADLGLLPSDDVDGLDYVVNPSPLPEGEGTDGDGVGAGDNCPGIFNPAQADFDVDGIGDECDPCSDRDGDGLGELNFPNNSCPPDYCPAQTGGAVDTDGDEWGDICDSCPATADPLKWDSDIDGIGDVCDNCPLDTNVSQADADGDGIGDACDVCPGGAPVVAPQLSIKKLGSPGLERMSMRGALAFPGSLPAPPMELHNDGMWVRILDVGPPSRWVIDHVVPPGLVPTACGPYDGWKTNTASTAQKYKNRTGTIPGACAAGSALGIFKASGRDATAVSKGARFSVSGKNATYGPVRGPLHMTVVLGNSFEANAGQCGDFAFSTAACRFNKARTRVICR